jgi:hypothetical protein
VATPRSGLHATKGAMSCYVLTYARLASHQNANKCCCNAGNVALAIPSLHAVQENKFLRKPGLPETGVVKRKDRRLLEPGVPRYLVSPASYPMGLKSSDNKIKIVDFGQSFLVATPLKSSICHFTFGLPR